MYVLPSGSSPGIVSMDRYQLVQRFENKYHTLCIYPLHMKIDIFYLIQYMRYIIYKYAIHRVH